MAGENGQVRAVLQGPATDLLCSASLNELGLHVDVVPASERDEPLQICARLPLSDVPVERVRWSRIHVRIRLQHAENGQRDSERCGDLRRVEHNGLAHLGTVNTHRNSPERCGRSRSSPLKILSGQERLEGAGRSHVRLLGTSQFARRLAARRRCSRILGHRGVRLWWFLCGIDLPLVQALHAGIDQRSADVVVEHRAMRPADRTRDDGRGCDGHRGAVPFFVILLGSSNPRRTHVAYHVSDAADGEFLPKERPHRGLPRLAAEFPALARRAPRGRTYIPELGVLRGFPLPPIDSTAPPSWAHRWRSSVPPAPGRAGALVHWVCESNAE
jgi:hypothetical protein